MHKDLNYRFGLYLLSGLVIFILLLIYLEIRDLNKHMTTLVVINEVSETYENISSNDMDLDVMREY